MTTTGLWLALALAAVGAFFFVGTRGALLLRAARGAPSTASSHIYPLYSQPWLMSLVDFQPIIAAILLFQYDRLVNLIARGMRASPLEDGEVLVTSCAFGNVIPKLVGVALRKRARRVIVSDLLQAELDHVAAKLDRGDSRLEFRVEDANHVRLPDRSVQANIIFFLLHELPHEQKTQVLQEAVRVLAPGGRLWLAEFHRPRVRVLKALSWAYFKVFEPLGLALWDSHDPLRQLAAMPGIRCRCQVLFFGNFQVIEATRSLA